METSKKAVDLRKCLEQELAQLNGKVVRFKEYVAQCGVPLFDDRCWGIMNDNGRVNHYLCIRTDELLGGTWLNYHPEQHILDIVRDSKHKSELEKFCETKEVCHHLKLAKGDPYTSGSFGIVSARALECSPRDYDDWLSRVFDMYRINGDLNQEHFKVLNVRKQKGGIVINLGPLRLLEFH